MQAKTKHIGIMILAVVIFPLLVASCDWIKEDLPECPPTELRLRFVYDYNVMQADVFKDHVGAVRVYVFDKDDKLVMTKEETSQKALQTYGYEMTITGDELPEGDYRLVTVAFQSPAAMAAAGDGAKFRIAAMSPGDPISKLNISLDSNLGADGRRYVVNAGNPLDTLWMNIADNRVKMQTRQSAHATVNLMRDTKNLNVTLRQLMEPETIDCADYEVTVSDHNGLLNYDNTPLGAEEIVYAPYATWNTEYRLTDGTLGDRAAHASLSLSRLIYNADWQQNARLQIRNRKTGVTVADINLPEYLQSGRNALERHYGEQEFLDREYDYKLDFFLKGDTWTYVDISISVLGWKVRVQNVDL